MRYIIQARKLGEIVELYGRYPTEADMVKELTEDGFVINSYETENGKIVAGELLEKDCLCRELKKERKQTKLFAKKMIKPLIALVIWNGLITIGFILISILSNLR